MVAHRFVEALRARDENDLYHVTVIAEEPRMPYDRVGLSALFSGTHPDELTLGDRALWDDAAVTLRTGSAVVGLDLEARAVATAGGGSVGYDHLVLATGSSAWVPPVPGADLAGVFVYRTVDDVVALRDWVRGRETELGRPARGVVVGGGLLGLEAAGALVGLEVDCTVVEFAPRLMALQVDDGGGHALRRIVEGLGVDVRVGAASEAVVADEAGRVAGLRIAGGEELPVDVVVFATGVRPRDELAAPAGLATGERGGVVVDDGCATSDPRVHAIGEVACIRGRCLGLVAPGYAMAEVVVDRLLGGTATFPGADLSTKLKLLGVDVASFGDAFAATPGALELVYSNPAAGTYAKLVVTDDARTLLGGVLVGDASAYASLRPMVGHEIGGDPSSWLVPAGPTERPQVELPADATVCSCNAVSAGVIRDAVAHQGCHDLGSVKGCTKAGTSCGSCVPLVKKLMTAELARAGVAVSSAMCEHLALSRAQ
ncbi:MAG: FAD-dependent oxidoreductase, partial [Phycicoccus sp.]